MATPHSSASEGSGLQASCARALEHIGNAIRRGHQFPEMVLREGWHKFRFVESDLLFQPEFVELVRQLLKVDGGNCVVVQNLDGRPLSAERREDFITLDLQTEVASYLGLLKGDASEVGWRYLVDTFASASDAGQWCLYCEIGTEIAVFASKPGDIGDRAVDLIEGLGARSIRAALSEHLSYGLYVANPAYRDRLISNYGD